MATITLQVGTQRLSTDPSALGDLAKAPEDLRFVLDPKSQSLLDQPLSSLPAGASIGVTYDGGKLSWTFDGSEATFCLQPKASGSLSVSPAGDLFTYYLDFEGARPKKYAGKNGCYYVILGIEVNISGKLSASAPLGSFGVSTTDSASTTFAVRNYKPFAPGTILRDALSGAFGAFTLPLHAGTVDQLEDGAAIYYELDGALNVGFGVTYGIEGSAAGFTLAEISSLFEKIASVLNVSSSSTFTAGVEAGPSVKFNWSRRFRCFLERAQPDASNRGAARLHVDAGGESSRAGEISADAGILKLSAPKLSVNQSTLLAWVRERAFGKDAAQPGQPFETALEQLTGQLPKYADDVNDWLTGLFAKLDPYAKMSLALLFQQTNAFTSAFTWDFDLTSPAFPEAWQRAIEGDFVAALSTGAATLEPYSGFEREYYDTTKLAFTFFGVSVLTDINTYFANSRVQYAGNGQFYLDSTAGNVVSLLGLDRKTSASLYLEATGLGSLEPGGAMNTSHPQILLHGIISADNDRGQTGQIARILCALGTLARASGDGQGLAPVSGAFTTFASQAHPGAASLHVIFEAAALARLPSDEANWGAYVWASAQLPSAPARALSIWVQSDFYQGYSAWQNFNRKMNGFTDANGEPDPERPADPQSLSPCTPALIASLYPGAFSDDQARMLIEYFCAGQQYMKLCEDLKATLVGLSATARADWHEVTSKLASIAHSDINAWFGATVILALARSAGVAAAAVSERKFVASACSATIQIS